MTIQDRIKPCRVCGYPITESHHMAEQRFYGRNNSTIRLCPNCHDLFHRIKSNLGGNDEKNISLGSLSCLFYDDHKEKIDEKFYKILDLAKESAEIDNEILSRRQ